MGISVIIPVYNIKKEYIEKALNSLKDQTFQDWEAIIVDDGSKVDCAGYLDSFVDERIQVFHKSNGGVSDARNYGIVQAKKDWIFFMDPDDWMGLNELEVLFNWAIRENADCVVANAYIVKEKDTYKSLKRSEEIFKFEGKDQLNELILEAMAPTRYKKKTGKSLGLFLRTPWGRIYKSSVIKKNGIKFPTGLHPHEDVFFNIYYWQYCRSVIVLNDCLHYYRINNASVTVGYRDSWIDNNTLALSLGKEYFEEFYDIEKYFEEWTSYCLILIVDVCKLQIFHPSNLNTYKQKVRILNNLLGKEPDFKATIDNWNNCLYPLKKRGIALLLKLRLYWCVNICVRKFV